MTEKKQNVVEKTTPGKKEDHRSLVAKPGVNQNTIIKTGTTSSLSDLIKQLEESGKQGYFTIHYHNGACTINHSHQIISVPGGNAMLDFLIKIAPLMVKDSSITAPVFIAAVIKEVPLMDKDPSLTLPKLMEVMDSVKSTLLPKAA